MVQIVTVINLKGGTGKTSCAVELSTALAHHYGRRTLLVDLDPQASATFYILEQARWLQWRKMRGTTYDLFEHRDHSFPIRNAILPNVLEEAKIFGLDLLPSNPDLVDMDVRLADFVGNTILQPYFEEIAEDYDYIICDCPPNFNPVTKNSLCASNAYVVPAVPDFLSTYGIGLLQRAVHKLFESPDQDHMYGPVLGGIILTRIHAGVKLHTTYCERVRAEYPRQVFKHTISDSIVVAHAADNRLPVSAIASPKGKEKDLQEQFKDLAGEFISRIFHVQTMKRQGLRPS
jgi:chromosome partitioning protein